MSRTATLIAIAVAAHYPNRMRRALVPLLALTTAGSVRAQNVPAPVQLDIRTDSLAFQPAAAEYQAIWARDGVRIIAAMQRFSGLAFHESTVPVLVIAGASSSGRGSRPMRLRASYPEPTKRGTLIHELGHRLQNHLFARGEDDHPYLFLWLYDTWRELYGTAFADSQVAVESARLNPRHDYAGLWRAVLARDSSARAEAWRALRDRRHSEGQ